MTSGGDPPRHRGFPLLSYAGRRTLTRNAVTLAGYYLLARSTAHLAVPHTGITPEWPPSGLAVAALFAWGWEVLPGTVVASLIFNLTAVHLPIPVAAGLAAGNSAEYIVASALLRHFRFDPALSRIRDAVGLIGLAALASPLIAASIGLLSEWLGGVTRHHSLALIWSTYWLGDGTGILIATPILLVGRELLVDSDAVGPLSWEFFLVVAGFAGMSWFAFFNGIRVTYILFAIGILIAIRYRTTGACAANAVISVIAELGTTHGHGPFRLDPLSSRLLDLQTYRGSFAVMVFVLAAATNTRLRADRQILNDNDALEQHIELIGKMGEQSAREREQTQREHDRLQAQLNQSLRLESLGQLSGGIAHDFNNLLAVIINYATYVRKKLLATIDPDESEAVRRETQVSLSGDVDQIVIAAEKAARLTHRLLAFARQEAATPVVVELNSIVHGIIELLRRTLGEHIAFVVVPSAMPLDIRADPGQIEQVLVNLVVNARDAMPDGGELTISTRPFAADDVTSDKPTGKYALLTVADGGFGMSREVIERAFDPFFSTKPIGQGTGLGLSTVYGIVTNAGGRVWIDSEPGEGTTVSVLLPLAESRDSPVHALPDGFATSSSSPDSSTSVPAADGPATPASAIAVPPGDTGNVGGAGPTTLVVEDEPALLEVVRRTLVDHGYTVIATPDPREAIALARTFREPIDVLLTDMVMPGISGVEVARQIGADHPESRIVFMSGYTRQLLDELPSGSGDYTLIGKPFTEAELIAAVSSARVRRA